MFTVKVDNIEKLKILIGILNWEKQNVFSSEIQFGPFNQTEFNSRPDVECTMGHPFSVASTYKSSGLVHKSDARLPSPRLAFSFKGNFGRLGVSGHRPAEREPPLLSRFFSSLFSRIIICSV